MDFKLTTGIVVDNVDKDSLGRIDVKVYTTNTEGHILTCYPVFTKLGNNGYEDGDVKNLKHVGSFSVPHIGQTVLIAYSDDSKIGYYIGSIANYQDEYVIPEIPALSSGNQENVDVIIRTKSGQSIVVNETQGNSFIRITGKKRQYNPNNPISSVTRIDGNQSIIQINGENDNVEIYSKNDIVIRTDGAKIIMKKSGHIIIQGSRIDLNP